MSCCGSVHSFSHCSSIERTLRAKDLPYFSDTVRDYLLAPCVFWYGIVLWKMQSEIKSVILLSTASAKNNDLKKNLFTYERSVTTYPQRGRIQSLFISFHCGAQLIGTILHRNIITWTLIVVRCQWNKYVSSCLLTISNGISNWENGTMERNFILPLIYHVSLLACRLGTSFLRPVHKDPVMRPKQTSCSWFRPSIRAWEISWSFEIVKPLYPKQLSLSKSFGYSWGRWSFKSVIYFIGCFSSNSQTL